MSCIVVRGRGEIAVGTVYCLGRNYAEHAREMRAPAVPVVFLKPGSSLAPGGGELEWPPDSALVHHEVELVLLLGGGGRRLPREQADDAIAAVGIGVDLTARDLQDAAKRDGGPWARSKGFPGAAPVSDFAPHDTRFPPWAEIDLYLSVDGAERQRDTAASMLLDPPAAVALLSTWFELAAGDLVFTGTPAGVGPIEPGQLVRAECRALSLELAFTLRR